MARKIDYEKLLRKASLSVVREILKHAAAEGFSKQQHLYITFTLSHKDVKVSDELRDDFNDEMTIILQYEFWDLTVDEAGFSVGLAFEHADEILYIPFAALVAVNDPSEDFSLDFVPDLADTKIRGGGVKQEKPTTQASAKIIQLDAFRKNDK
ncbi:MAG: ClpXP protease specificity-enhancing factor SspB [Holosporales bacterium]|jgi:hypothetical protein|nr:ClpXP protease specificity-enhancing factor SspB [Holosporales bacterium]